MRSLKLSDSIRKDVEELNIEHIKSDYKNRVTISIGLVAIENITMDTRLFMKKRILYYQAKKAGRNKLMEKVI